MRMFAEWMNRSSFDYDLLLTRLVISWIFILCFLWDRHNWVMYKKPIEIPWSRFPIYCIRPNCVPNLYQGKNGNAKNSFMIQIDFQIETNIFIQAKYKYPTTNR